MFGAFFSAATMVFSTIALFLFWVLGNEFGAKISFRKLVLILVGLLLVLYSMR